MSETPEIVVFRNTRTPEEAQVLVTVLKSAGIPCYVGGQNLTDEFALSQLIIGTGASVKIEIPAHRREDAEKAVAEAREAGESLDTAEE